MEYEQDLEKIKAAYKDREYTITNEEAEDIWGTYSDRLFASWMMIPDDTNGIFEMTEDIAKELKVIIPPIKNKSKVHRGTDRGASCNTQVISRDPLPQYK